MTVTQAEPRYTDALMPASSTKAVWPMLLIACGLACLSASASSAWEDRLADVEGSYDIAATESFIETLRAESGVELALAQALLNLAELHRIAFEALDETDRSERRAIGDQIDAAAEEGIGLLESLPESSHQQRLQADLFSVKIRSKYRAKRFRDDMERAAARAIELDPNNAAAYVSASKTYLFADEDHRGDIDRAVELLEQALERDPNLEKAHLLLAYAREQNGEVNLATERLETILEKNPECRPARDALERLCAEAEAEADL